MTTLRTTNHIQRIDAWIRHSFRMSPEAMGLFRILYVLSMVLFYGIPDLHWLGNNPDLIFQPPTFSLVVLTDHLPGNAFFIVWSLLVLGLHVSLLVGYRTATTSVTLSFLLIVGHNYLFSFGKIDHNLLVILLPGIMGLAGWGGAYSVDAKQQRTQPHRPWILTFFALLLGFGMLTATAPKLYTGWLSWDHQATQYFFYKHYFQRHNPALLGSLAKGIHAKWVWEVADYAVVLFEGLFLFSLVRARWFRAFIWLAFGFHWMNVLTIDISFFGMIPVYLVFFNWDHLHARLQKWGLLKKMLHGQWLLLIIPLMAVLSVCTWFPYPSVIRVGPSVVKLWLYYMGLPVMMYLGIVVLILGPLIAGLSLKEPQQDNLTR